MDYDSSEGDSISLEVKQVETYELRISGPVAESGDIDHVLLGDTLKGWSYLLRLGERVFATRSLDFTIEQIARHPAELRVRAIRNGSIVIDIALYILDAAATGIIGVATWEGISYVRQRRYEIYVFLRQFILKFFEARMDSLSYEEVLDKYLDFLQDVGMASVEKEAGIDAVRAFDRVLELASRPIIENSDEIQLVPTEFPEAQAIVVDSRARRSIRTQLPDRSQIDSEAVNATIIIKRLHFETGHALVDVVRPKRLASMAKYAVVDDVQVREPNNEYANAFASQSRLCVIMRQKVDGERVNPTWHIEGTCSQSRTLFDIEPEG